MKGAPRKYNHGEIRRMRWAGMALTEIAKIHGCHWTSVRRICRDIPVDGRALKMGEPGQVIVTPIKADLSYSKHDPMMVAEIFALRGKKSASAIAKQFGLASRCVVIGIWNRARDRGATA